MGNHGIVSEPAGKDHGRQEGVMTLYTYLEITWRQNLLRNGIRMIQIKGMGPMSSSTGVTPTVGGTRISASGATRYSWR